MAASRRQHTFHRPKPSRKLLESLRSRREEALLYRRLATLRTDVPLTEELKDLEWRGAAPVLKEVCAELGDEGILTRIPRWRNSPA